MHIFIFHYTAKSNFFQNVVLINIRSSSYVFIVLSFMFLILCPFLFSLRRRDWYVILAFLSLISLCHADSFSPNIKQLMSRMRKMPAHILILKSKAIEMSCERFRSVECNKNIFVWKCHNQHSCALRTAWGKINKKKLKALSDE